MRFFSVPFRTTLDGMTIFFVVLWIFTLQILKLVLIMRSFFSHSFRFGAFGRDKGIFGNFIAAFSLRFLNAYQKVAIYGSWQNFISFCYCIWRLGSFLGWSCFPIVREVSFVRKPSSKRSKLSLKAILSVSLNSK